MSSGLSSKSNTAKFSTILSVRTDFGDRDDASLHEPAHHDLRDRPAVVTRDRREDGVLEQTVPAFGELAPGLVLHAESTHDLGGLDLLTERVCLDLVHGGSDLVVQGEVEQVPLQGDDR